jgi:hypothetical protein
MALYQWHGWGILPLFIAKSVLKKTLRQQPWQQWCQSLSDDCIKDRRRFFSRLGAQFFRPLSGGRYELDLANTTVGGLSLQTNDVSITLGALTLIEFEDVVMLYIHMQSHDEHDAKQLSVINRMAFAWEPKTLHHSVNDWTDQHGVCKPLKQHIRELLGIDLDQECSYGDDAFGHELANCTWFKQTKPSTHQSPCVSEFSAGIDISNTRYQLADTELQRLKQQQFSYWNDWRCQLNLGRLVFVDDTPTESSPLTFNLKQAQYYLDLFALVLLQKLMLGHFKEQLVLANAKQRVKLFRKIELFRRKFKVSLISTYPFANKLYNYFCQQSELDFLEEKIFTELEYSHSLWRGEREEMSNSMMLFISLIAAVLLPASSIATIFALSDTQMNSYFWGISSLFTLLTLAVIVQPLLRRKSSSSLGN